MELSICPSTLAEGYSTYSPKALKTLFDGVKVSHQLDFDGPANSDIATHQFTNAVGHISVSGVQPKLAMVIGEDCKLRYANACEQGAYIAKPQPYAYHILHRAECPANENLTMQIASQAYGIPTAANGLAFYADGSHVYITRRFDIMPGGVGKYLLEDFASLLGVTRANGGSEFKYCNGSYEECGDIIREYVRSWPIDISRFFKLVVFNFLTLNDDAHLKNFSLIKTDSEYRLAPAYDLTNTSLHLSRPRIFALDRGLFREGMSISDTNGIRRADFEEFGKRLNLPDTVIKKILDEMSAPSPMAKRLIDCSFLTSESKRMYWLSYDYRRKLLTF